MTEPSLYKASLKSEYSDEWINTYFLRPLAGVLVRILYPTRVTPNQVTIASIVAGIAAATCYLQDTSTGVIAGGLLITLKDLLDSADGQLARAKSQYSRTGRFLDSLGDILVDFLVFGAMGWVLSNRTGDPWYIGLALVSFIGITLRVSYHVFYQASYLHLEGNYRNNRIVEEITEEDLQGKRNVLVLQRLFLLLYGWQDRLMLRIDGWCRHGRLNEEIRQRWYRDGLGLRLSGLLGFGTELFLLTLCSLFQNLELYLILNITLMNGILILSILYRRSILSRTILTVSGSSEADDTV